MRKLAYIFILTAITLSCKKKSEDPKPEQNKEKNFISYRMVVLSSTDTPLDYTASKTDYTICCGKNRVYSIKDQGFDPPKKTVTVTDTILKRNELNLGASNSPISSSNVLNVKLYIDDVLVSEKNTNHAIFVVKEGKLQ